MCKKKCYIIHKYNCIYTQIYIYTHTYIRTCAHKVLN